MNNLFKRVAIGGASLSGAAVCLRFGLDFQGLGRVLLICLAILVAMLAVAVLFGSRVLVGVLAIAVTGVLLGGSIWLADSKATGSKVIGFVFTYLTWLAFSASVFGVPVIVLPFPPFFIFAWQKLSEQQKRDMLLRLLTIGILAAIAAGVTGFPRQKTSTQNSSAEQPLDTLATRMQRTIQIVLEKDERLNIRDLNIAVSADRVVTINGVAPNASTRLRAENAVAELPGVMKVVNSLRVE